ncbi:UDP binding domain-containing protein [Streptomyces sp. NPDC060065]|uniref:UDP binding domain-containing protein n=1 Tax=Streptomyces sp. NPDC060065 TaxID=3347050 RepID=UPI0036A69C30
MVDLAEEQLDGTLTGKRTTIWGAAFKPETDDIRDSPALAVAHKLHELGATVSVTDPKALDNARKARPELDYIEDPIAAVQNADLLLHLTEWPQYSHIDPAQLAARTASPLVIDGRGTLDTGRWRKAGWTLRCFGQRGETAGRPGGWAQAAATPSKIMILPRVLRARRGTISW